MTAGTTGQRRGAALAEQRSQALMARLAAGGTVTAEPDGITRFTHPVPRPRTSGLLVPPGPVDPSRLRSLADGFVQRGLPWSIGLGGEVPPEVEALAGELGMVRLQRPVLVRPLQAEPVPDPTGAPVDLRRVADEEDRHRWAAVMEAAYGLPVEIALQMLGPEAVHHPALRWYLAVRDGQAVGTAFSVLDESGWLGVSTVGTVPEARGAGTASRLVAVLLAEGAAAGAHTAHLVSSPMAERMYARLGFRYEGEDTVGFLTPRADGTGYQPSPPSHPGVGR